MDVMVRAQGIGHVEVADSWIEEAIADDPQGYERALQEALVYAVEVGTFDLTAEEL